MRVPLPRWLCHKEVEAVRILDVNPIQPGTATEAALIIPEDPGVPSFPVSRKFLIKHQPKAGGYFVRYADGYESFSPAAAFEGGYTRI